jgi:hypothetical protein
VNKKLHNHPAFERIMVEHNVMPSLSQVIAHGMGNRVVQAFRIWVAENDQYSHVLSFTQRPACPAAR